MKSIIFSALIGLFSFSLCYGQDSPVDENSFILDGGFSYNSYNDIDYSVLTVNPAASMFLFKNLSVGISVMYHSEVYEQNDGVDYSLFGIGPSVEYYYTMNRNAKHISGTTYVVIGLSYFRTQEKYNLHDDTGDIFVNANAISYKAGTVTMLGGHLGFHTELVFTVKNFEDSDSENSYGISGGLSYFIY